MGTEKLRGIVLREQARGESNKQIVLLAQGVGRVLLSPVVPEGRKVSFWRQRSCSAMPILWSMRVGAFIPSRRRS